MRGEAFRVLNRTPLKYIAGHTHGDIISRMVNDADLVAEGFCRPDTAFAGSGYHSGTLVVMAVLNPVIALVVVLVTPVSIALRASLPGAQQAFSRRRALRRPSVRGFVNEMVAGQSVVKAFWLRGPLFRTVRRHQR